LDITPEKEWKGLAKELNQEFEDFGVRISK
jgi:hypothetical protein